MIRTYYIELVYRDQVRDVEREEGNMYFNSIKKEACQLFGLRPEEFKILWKDRAGDMITMKNQRHLRVAMMYLDSEYLRFVLRPINANNVVIR